MEDFKIISVLVKNRFGALTRVSNVFSRRGVNIKQLTVAETRADGISRITILASSADIDYRQLEKQLLKIEDVKEAVTLAYDESISRELLLVKIKYDEKTLEKIQQKLFFSSGKIISFDKDVLVGQIVATSEIIDAFIQSIVGYDIVEMSRSGVTALDKRHKTFDFTLNSDNIKK